MDSSSIFFGPASHADTAGIPGLCGMRQINPPYASMKAVDLNTGKMIGAQLFGEARNNCPWGIPSMLPLTRAAGHRSLGQRPRRRGVHRLQKSLGVVEDRQAVLAGTAPGRRACPSGD